MKKIIFSSAAAVLAVFGFSAFKNAKTTGLYYWFTVNTTLANGSNINSTELKAPPIFPIAVTALTAQASCPGGSDYCEVSVPTAAVNLTVNKLYITSFNTSFSGQPTSYDSKN